MFDSRRQHLGTVLALVCALCATSSARATGVPITGFYAMMGLSLTNRFKDENDDSFYISEQEPSLLGTQLGVGGTPFYDLALLDTGAAVSLITSAADTSFNIQGAGFRGTETLDIGGATGIVTTTINDPMAMFLTGLSNRTSTAPLTFDTSAMVGQSSVSLLTLPPESELPNVIGIPFLSTYATFIRNDQPQIFQLNGKTVRSPQVQLLPRGTGNLQGIARNELLTLDSDTGFSSQAPPTYIFNFNNIFTGEELTEDPTAPTVMQAPGALFMNVSVSNTDSQGTPHSLGTKQFFLDTGADVTVISTDNAVALGIDPLLTPPDFTVAIIGSGGITDGVPGYFVDTLTIPTSGGIITANNVPVLVLNVPNPARSGLIVDGILGTNILAGRNVVIDPNPAIEPGGDPAIYISDPVTTAHSWASVAASANWATSGNWNAAGTPGTLWIANTRHVSGGSQEAAVSADSTVWELNVSGPSANSMTVRVQSGVRLTTFSGANIELGGRIQLEGGTLDAQFVDIRGGTLTGSGSVLTGSGPIDGQVENHGGIVAPGNGVGTLNVSGRFANTSTGTLALELGGTTAGTQYDQLIIDGSAAIDGALALSLVNAFVPIVGNSFTLITAADGVGGAFDQVLGPDGFNWKVNYNANNVQLVVGNPGDFNNDGRVDGADYVKWRNDAGGPLNYNAWRSNYGVTYGSGAGVGGSGAVPEPTSAALIFFAACGLAASRRFTRPVRFAA